MSFTETVLLGALAGLTIYIGLPVGRIRRVSQRTRVALAMFAVGVLSFIFMDVASHAEGILSVNLSAFRHHRGGLGHVIWLFALLAVAFVAGTGGLASAQLWLQRRVRRLPPIAGGADSAAAAAALPAPARSQENDAAHKRALQTGMTIAMAIGLHNFAEGLAIGVSARTGAIALATLLIIGFSLHNATEGFGIVGPLAGTRPSWRWLGGAGLVAGGPTFLGSVVGYQVHSDPLELLFYGLAAGAIIYVIGEIWVGMRRYGHRVLGLYLLALGFLAGVATDLIVTYAGA
ncbi:MAG TPA: ZIP family metal transporter [Solirubrobacteraceae bacterium]|nr:ZIP family metal transporter [Solirubrobacteraceae bacterium]